MNNLASTTMGLLSLLLLGQAWAATLEGRVVSVQDGDTITVLDAWKQQYRIRLAGIDAPERGQAFAGRSRQNLSRLVAGRNVTAECHKADRYKRQVCTVWVAPTNCHACPRTINVGLTQISDGLAWHYKAYEREQTAGDRRRYGETEIAAHGRRVGLWMDRHPVPPWEWRTGARTPTEER